MLYIVMTMITFSWVFLLKKNTNVSWFFLINTYAIGVMFVDIAEIVLNQFMGLYKFPTKLLSDPLKDNQLGVLFSDVLILPFTSILFIYYASKYKKRRVILLFAVSYTIIEIIFLKTGFLTYKQWSVWFSFFAYLIGFSLFSLYSERLLFLNPPLPYRFRLFSIVYSITAIIGGALGGALIGLYQWRPGIFEFPPADDRFADLGLSFVLGVLIGTIIPFFSSKFRPLMFILITLSIIAFSIYSSLQGWLIYHHWNHILTTIKWLVPIIIVIFYDRWESRDESFKS